MVLYIALLFSFTSEFNCGRSVIIKWWEIIIWSEASYWLLWWYIFAFDISINIDILSTVCFQK